MLGELSKGWSLEWGKMRLEQSFQLEHPNLLGYTGTGSRLSTSYGMEQHERES